MDIQFRYEKSERYSDERIEVYANKANIGTLSTMAVAPDQLCWSPDTMTYNVKFQFRNEETFMAVVEELKRYKNEHGYKYLTIWTYNEGYASKLDKGMLERAGFKNLPDEHPACMFLE